MLNIIFVFFTLNVLGKMCSTNYMIYNLCGCASHTTSRVYRAICTLRTRNDRWLLV